MDRPAPAGDLSEPSPRNEVWGGLVCSHHDAGRLARVAVAVAVLDGAGTALAAPTRVILAAAAAAPVTLVPTAKGVGAVQQA